MLEDGKQVFRISGFEVEGPTFLVTLGQTIGHIQIIDLLNTQLELEQTTDRPNETLLENINSLHNLERMAN